ncbi:MAG TPA: cytochrome c biogenesis CcdA family protein, partial [Waddliaceae bacterium]
MWLLLLFAFLSGIITVLSPCILPILPALLSAGTAKGRSRPLGIIVGLIASFSFFTLTLTAIVHALGISANVLRNVAIVLVLIFGLVMLFPRLSDWFAKITSHIASAGQKIQPIDTKGFWGGIFFGIALGLLWTPCAGPILATITALVATRAVTTTAILMTIFYSIGAGIPLFFIAYGSSKIINASRYLSKHAEGIRR